MLESQSQVKNENVECISSDHFQNTAGNSMKLYSASNSVITTNKNTNFGHEEQEKIILHAEGIDQDASTMKSLSENILNRPDNLHRVSNE